MSDKELLRWVLKLIDTFYLGVQHFNASEIPPTYFEAIGASKEVWIAFRERVEEYKFRRLT